MLFLWTGAKNIYISRHWKHQLLQINKLELKILTYDMPTPVSSYIGLQEFQTFENGPVFWPTLYMRLRLWLQSFFVHVNLVWRDI